MHTYIYIHIVKFNTVFVHTAMIEHVLFTHPTILNPCQEY
jgi:hypothetical protein